MWIASAPRSVDLAGLDVVQKLTACWELTKPRVAALVVAVAWAGVWLGGGGARPPPPRPGDTVARPRPAQPAPCLRVVGGWVPGPFLAWVAAPPPPPPPLGPPSPPPPPPPQPDPGPG